MDTCLENRLAQFEAAGQFILNFLDPNELISPGGALGMPMTAPSTAVSVVFLYISFVLVMPLVMKAFPPLELYPVKFLYNLSQIMLCSYSEYTINQLTHTHCFSVSHISQIISLFFSTFSQ